MIAIIDYGVGNLFSLKSSLDFIGLDTKITNNEKEIREADAIILPGVGAFRDAIEKLGGTMPEDLPTPDKSLKEIEEEQNIKAKQIQSW